MIIRITVLLAALAQIPAAIWLSVGTFETTARSFPTLIQPAGWAFSIWGVIYALSIIFALYQLVPRYDNQLLRRVRLPALVAFVGSSLWLYCAGMDNWSIWLTIPILLSMAIALNYIVIQPTLPARWPQWFSHYTLFPYAAWTGIAVWLNIQALLNEQNIITNSELNLVSNVTLLLIAIACTGYVFRRSGYTLWYGGVIVWAGIGIVAANVPNGSLLIACMAGAVSLGTLLFIAKN